MSDSPTAQDGAWPSLLLMAGAWFLHVAGQLDDLESWMRVVLILLQVVATFAAIIVAIPKAVGIIQKWLKKNERPKIDRP